jgi:hypothetical protein
MAKRARRYGFFAATVALAGVVIALLPPYPAAFAIWSMTAAGR